MLTCWHAVMALNDPQFKIRLALKRHRTVRCRYQVVFWCVRTSYLVASSGGCDDALNVTLLFRTERLWICSDDASWESWMLLLHILRVSNLMSCRPCFFQHAGIQTRTWHSYECRHCFPRTLTPEDSNSSICMRWVLNTLLVCLWSLLSLRQDFSGACHQCSSHCAPHTKYTCALYGSVLLTHIWSVEFPSHSTGSQWAHGVRDCLPVWQGKVDNVTVTRARDATSLSSCTSWQQWRHEFVYVKP
jgi:hypothetical protein